MPTPTTAQAAPSVDRPLRSPTEHTTAVMQDVSGCLNQLAELHRQLWSVAVANAEAQLTIAIDVQTAALNPASPCSTRPPLPPELRRELE